MKRKPQEIRPPRPAVRVTKYCTCPGAFKRKLYTDNICARCGREGHPLESPIIPREPIPFTVKIDGPAPFIVGLMMGMSIATQGFKRETPLDASVASALADLAELNGKVDTAKQTAMEAAQLRATRPPDPDDLPPLRRALLEFGRDKPSWTGSALDLHKLLNQRNPDQARGKFWPTTPATLVRILHRDAVELGQIGISIQWHNSIDRNGRRMTITHRERAPLTPEAS